jgi:hypothetical protein
MVRDSQNAANLASVLWHSCTWLGVGSDLACDLPERKADRLIHGDAWGPMDAKTRMARQSIRVVWSISVEEQFTSASPSSSGQVEGVQLPFAAL